MFEHDENVYGIVVWPQNFIMSNFLCFMVNVYVKKVFCQSNFIIVEEKITVIACALNHECELGTLIGSWKYECVVLLPNI